MMGLIAPVSVKPYGHNLNSVPAITNNSMTKVDNSDLPKKQRAVSGKIFLGQMANVSFKGGDDDLSPYYNYSGGKPPAIEIEKYNLSEDAVDAVLKGDFLKAAKLKLENANICRGQGKEEDAFFLETSAHEYLMKVAENGKPYEAGLVILGMAKNHKELGNKQAAEELFYTAMQLINKGLKK